MIKLKVDPEFQNKIPPLTDAEFEQLRDNILDDGEVFEPIITWNGIIVDGHNRWRILQEYPEIPFKTREMIFFDKWEAFDWMYKKQLGRRNLTNEQRLRLIGQMQSARKKSVGAQVENKNAEKQMVQNEPIVFSTPERKSKSTAQAIANELGISESTVKRAEKFSKGIDALEEVSKDAAKKVLSGKSSVTKAMIMELPKAEPQERKNIAKAIMEDKPIKKEEKPKEVQIEKLQEYTVENLLFEINFNADQFIQFLRQTLANRNQVYQTPENKDSVVEAINSVIKKIKKLQEVLES